MVAQDVYVTLKMWKSLYMHMEHTYANMICNFMEKARVCVMLHVHKKYFLSFRFSSI